ncbi:hypothetical protein EPUS_01442 [Endocarpon pusillum Z07020]|uniref:Mid2 domain-containing protein n=1 Tax=Endocarpon pusillum (strain Z07020 / HMAS-L-300199) TaxID=1263415 RepID=U1I2C3_ENDPU|nr:uncharacterized protein EPUS_01442 [Endocarpon pusillum Z07020]ERF76109.1 hypothetical protein EPUS_01442 [Endocarpon pusillum Z07020]
MRLFAVPSPLLCLLAVAPSTSLIEAAIIPSEGRVPKQEDNVIAKRQCATHCGFYGQVCCGPNEVCITDANNQAQCGPAGAQVTVAATTAAGQGNWQYYTTTYVQTDLRTITSTFSTFFPISTQNLIVTSTAASQCRYSLGESPCGSICCASGQYCMADINQCAAAGGGSSAYFSSFYTVTQVASVPVRPTSNTVLTVTSTGVATATVPYSTPVGTDGSTIIGAQPTTQGQRLSGGAIAGIVIGVIAGIIILFLICVCCCARGAIDGIMGIFGGGRKRRTETTYIEERRSHRGSRPAGRTWFGARPARVDRTEKRKKTGGGLGGLATVTAGLGALALLLGLKRRRDQRNDAKSSSSYSYYDESFTGTSESSLSSDRRTRDSRRSRR